MTSSDEDFVSIPATEDPQAALDAAAAVSDEDSPPPLQVPDDGPVTLPGGFRRLKSGDSGIPEYETVTTAWVRELDGFAEEKIAKARNKDHQDAFVNAILEAGVERFGSEEPDSDDFDSLLVGDRDFLLLEISKATYGNEIHYDDFVCPNPECGETISFIVHKDTDIPVKRLGSKEGAEFEVKLRKGKVTVHLPTVAEQHQALTTSTPAEFNSQLIGMCAFSGDVDAAQRLGLGDRQTIIRELGNRMPGPRYNEVTFTHPECGNEIRLAVTLADLFLGL